MNSGDTFDIGNDDISSITGGGNSLSIDIDSASMALSDFNVLNQGGALVASDSTVGNTRTIDWDNGVQLVLQA